MLRSEALRHNPWVRVLMVVGAIAWLGIAYTTANNAPGSPLLEVVSGDTWVLLCGIAAGALLAVARWGTLFALKSYVVVSTAIGFLRSLGYAMDDAYGPMWVWVLVGATTLALFVTLTPKPGESEA